MYISENTQITPCIFLGCEGSVCHRRKEKDLRHGMETKGESSKQAGSKWQMKTPGSSSFYSYIYNTLSVPHFEQIRLIVL